MAERDTPSERVEALNSTCVRPAIFFDCDGVLNEEIGDPGVVSPDDIRIVRGAGSALRQAREAGFLTIAVTNRPQVAKGLITFDGLHHILARLEALLAEDGGVLDRIYVCPHYPGSGFIGEVPELKIRCGCRKPGTLLLRQALAEFPIERSRSMLVGDSLRDIGAARGIGIWAYGVRTGYGCRDRARYLKETGAPPVPDLMFADVSEAVEFGIGYRDLAAPILSEIGPAAMRGRQPIVLGVAGRSRSGKTVLAHAVARSLLEDGVACLHVRLDDWIIPVAERGPHASAEIRNRVEELPAVVARLRAGASVSAPGYDAAARGASEAVVYDASGQSVILIEGGFALHETVRSMLDFAVFATVPEELRRERFAAFYRWKGLDPEAIDALWRERAADEWQTVDQQRAGADLVWSAAVKEE